MPTMYSFMTENADDFTRGVAMRLMPYTKSSATSSRVPVCGKSVNANLPATSDAFRPR